MSAPRQPGFLALALLLAAFWPVWRWYGLRLDDGSDEPLGVLALAAAGAFLWRDRGRLGATRGSLGAAAAGLAGYALAFSWLPALPRTVLAIGLIGLAFRCDRVPPAVWGLFLLSLPVVATAQYYAGWPLRLATAAGATGLLNGAGLDATREGTVIFWRGVPVAVDAPCAGIRMLWTGLFFHGVLASVHRSRLRTLAWLTPLCLLLILAANVVRAVLLFFKEGGWIALPEWTHEGLGLAVFAGLLALFPLLHRPEPVPATGGAPPPGGRAASPAGFPPLRLRDLPPLAAGACLAALAPLMAMSAPAPAPSGPVEWPSRWEGIDLAPVPLTAGEEAFAKGFPGALAVFRTEEGPFSRRLILRRVDRATRKLHSSADCLRAAGCRLERRADLRVREGAETWSSWTATDPAGQSFGVRERIHEAGGGPGARQWTEVSAWYWSAALGKSAGPWWAVTVLEPIDTHER